MVCQRIAYDSKIRPENIILSSFMAGLSEFRILNQSLVNLAGKHAGQSLARYTDELGADELHDCEDPALQFNKIIDNLCSLLRVSIDANFSNNELEISIDRSTCNICPHKFMKKELKGTLCLFPAIIEEFVNYFWGHSILLSREDNFPYLKTHDNQCIIRYKINTAN